MSFYSAFIWSDLQTHLLDGLYELCLMLNNNNLCWAPVTRPRRVLDLGSGTGLWVKQIGELHFRHHVLH
jgi:hypothetical protein